MITWRPLQHSAKHRGLRCVSHPNTFSTFRCWLQKTSLIQNKKVLTPTLFLIDFQAPYRRPRLCDFDERNDHAPPDENTVLRALH